jgi:hypothetical protein
VAEFVARRKWLIKIQPVYSIEKNETRPTPPFFQRRGLDRAEDQQKVADV